MWYHIYIKTMSLPFIWTAFHIIIIFLWKFNTMNNCGSPKKTLLNYTVLGLNDYHLNFCRKNNLDLQEQQSNFEFWLLSPDGHLLILLLQLMCYFWNWSNLVAHSYFHAHNIQVIAIISEGSRLEHGWAVFKMVSRVKGDPSERIAKR